MIYGLDSIQNINISSEKYLEQRKIHFNQLYLNNNYKKEKTLELIKKKEYDIFCLQECDRQLIDDLKMELTEYVIVEMPNKLNKVCDSVILLKKIKFVGHNEATIETEREKFLG